MSFDELVADLDRAVQGALGGALVTYQPQSRSYMGSYLGRYLGSYLGAAASPVEVTGMFDAQYVLVSGSAEAGVETVGPAVFVRLEDLPIDPEDDEPTLTIGGVDYRVIERRPDGMGGILLVLRRT